jgi:opacity protein-like surface antigen
MDNSDLDGAEAETVDQGFRAGAHIAVPLGMGRSLSPFVQAGVLYNQTRIELSDRSGSLTFKSDNALGFEAGGGLSIPLGRIISITPAVRYRRHETKFSGFDEFGAESITVSYIVADIGMKFGL